MMPLLYSALYVLVLGIAAHFVGEAVPRRWFHHDRFPYRTYRWEKGGKLYDRLHIRAWKDRMPDMSRVMKDMVPKRVGRTPTSESVWVLVRETCVAEITHWILCLLAPVIWLFWFNWIGVALSALVIVCNLPFILIQRYNRPTLVSLATRLAAREERKRHANTETLGEHGGRT